MLKRTMVCALTLCMAQSLTLSAAQESDDPTSADSYQPGLSNSVQTQLVSNTDTAEDNALSSPSSSDPLDNSSEQPVANVEQFTTESSELEEHNSLASELTDRERGSSDVQSPEVDNDPSMVENESTAIELADTPSETVEAETLEPAMEFGSASLPSQDDQSAVEDELTQAPAEGQSDTLSRASDNTDTSAADSVANTDTSDDKRSLNEQVQSLKQQVLELNKDLFILEEELLFPANTQVAVYLSMNVGDFFQLDGVKLTIDDKVVTNYLYTTRQVDALYRGGVQRLFLGNLKTGEHELVAVFTGRGPKKRDYRRAATLVFEKSSQAKQIELKIVDSTATQKPEFVVKEW